MRYLGVGLLSASIAGAALYWPHIVSLGQCNANVHFVRVGMTLPEAEAFLGPAGGSYSSSTKYDYFIWKDRTTWVSVIVENGKISKTHIRPAP